jgi:flagellar biosynthetic protein FliQ
MGPDQVTELARHLLLEAFLLCAPLLLASALVSVLLSLVQTLTSIQEQSITTVPRLAVIALGSVVGMPWMLRQLVEYTIQLWTNMHRYLG